MAHLTQLGRQACFKISRLKNTGFAYIALLLILAGLGLVLGSAAEQIDQSAQREREEQLIFVGNQFREAIAGYYEKSPGTKRYPQKLEELLQDNRFRKPMRHLRRMYIDPMTNQADWQLVYSPQGGIVGVYSRSELTPIRTKLDADLSKAIGNRPVRYYSDWKFIYHPRDGSADFVLQESENRTALNDSKASHSGFSISESGKPEFDSQEFSGPDSPFGQLKMDQNLGSQEGQMEQNLRDTQ